VPRSPRLGGSGTRLPLEVTVNRKIGLYILESELLSDVIANCSAVKRLTGVVAITIHLDSFLSLLCSHSVGYNPSTLSHQVYRGVSIIISKACTREIRATFQCVALVMQYSTDSSMKNMQDTV